MKKKKKKKGKRSKKGASKKAGSEARGQASGASRKVETVEVEEDSKKPKPKKRGKPPADSEVDSKKVKKVKKVATEKPVKSDPKTAAWYSGGSGKGATFAKRYCGQGELQKNRFFSIKDSFEMFIKPNVIKSSHLQDCDAVKSKV